MATTYSDLLARARARTKAVPVELLHERLTAGERISLIDVREPDEAAKGRLPGAVHIPRGLLELEIETRLPDKTAPVVVYCAAGARSALAAATLADLGYLHVETATPGFERWAELGYPVEMDTRLTTSQRERYARHLRLPEVGEEGQVRLLASRVLVLGAGGLGSPAALYLAAAGVGTIGIVDDDTVKASNLQRQILHATSRMGAPKTASAAQTLSDLNPDVKTVCHQERMTTTNVERLLRQYELVIDATDNFQSRYLANDAAVRLGIPVVHGSVSRFDGQATTFIPTGAEVRFGVKGGPCYRCLYPAPPPPRLAPNCEEAGVLGVLCGVVGTIQATEALKLVLRRGVSLSGRLLTYDSLAMRFYEHRFTADPACKACGAGAPPPPLRQGMELEESSGR